MNKIQIKNKLSLANRKKRVQEITMEIKNEKDKILKNVGTPLADRNKRAQAAGGEHAARGVGGLGGMHKLRKALPAGVAVQWYDGL